MDPVGNQLGTAVQGPDSRGALGPSCQGGDLNTAMVSLVVPLGVCALLLVVLLGIQHGCWQHLDEQRQGC